MSAPDSSAAPLSPYVPRDLVFGRLQAIFPEGTHNRLFCVREMAASTVFTMIYIGAVEGSGVFLAPKHVYRMTREQAALSSDEARRHYRERAVAPGFAPAGSRWYADNSREGIRDETLREGLVRVGAAVARGDLPTTSGKPRYALRRSFAELFHPELDGDDLRFAIERFQHATLSKGALARLAIIRHGAARGALGLLVAFPSGETRQLAPGLSSTIAKAVIEVFANRFLRDPAVLAVSESGNKVVARDEALAASIGLEIQADKNLPDVILVDVATDDPLLVFVEVVATDGPMTERRREALLERTQAAGFDASRVAFVTAYLDRESPAFRRTIGSVAWGTFVWFASEPENLIVLRREGRVTLDAVN
jgi:BsuBI/PstI restriction endonuclease domain/BsuBI/PstI restriction endonuclease HTH domain